MKVCFLSGSQISEDVNLLSGPLYSTSFRERAKNVSFLPPLFFRAAFDLVVVVVRSKNFFLRASES